MKRTGEIVLTVIGTIFSLLGAIGTAIVTSLVHTDVFREGFEEGYNEGAIQEGYTYDSGEADTVLNVIAGFGWFSVIICVLGLIAGIIALIFLKGNKKPKAAGIILIIAAVIVLVGTFFTGVLISLLFLIAGIMALVRKPPLNEEPTLAVEE